MAASPSLRPLRYPSSSNLVPWRWEDTLFAFPAMFTHVLVPLTLLSHSLQLQSLTDKCPTTALGSRGSFSALSSWAPPGPTQRAMAIQTWLCKDSWLSSPSHCWNSIPLKEEEYFLASLGCPENELFTICKALCRVQSHYTGTTGLKSNLGCLTGRLLLLSIYIALYIGRVLPNHLLVNSPSTRSCQQTWVDMFSHLEMRFTRSGEASGLAQGYPKQVAGCSNHTMRAGCSAFDPETSYRFHFLHPRHPAQTTPIPQWGLLQGIAVIYHLGDTRGVLSVYDLLWHEGKSTGFGVKIWLYDLKKVWLWANF